MIPLAWALARPSATDIAIVTALSQGKGPSSKRLRNVSPSNSSVTVKALPSRQHRGPVANPGPDKLRPYHRLPREPSADIDQVRYQGQAQVRTPDRHLPSLFGDSHPSSCSGQAV